MRVEVDLQAKVAQGLKQELNEVEDQAGKMSFSCPLKAILMLFESYINKSIKERNK